VTECYVYSNSPVPFVESATYFHSVLLKIFPVFKVLMCTHARLLVEFHHFAISLSLDGHLVFWCLLDPSRRERCVSMLLIRGYIPSSGPVHLAYNPSFSACFFSRNSIFLSQKISQQCFSAGL
jgi:hypothetical protein